MVKVHSGDLSIIQMVTLLIVRFRNNPFFKFQVSDVIGGSIGYDVTGGMETKVKTMIHLCDKQATDGVKTSCMLLTLSINMFFFVFLLVCHLRLSQRIDATVP